MKRFAATALSAVTTIIASTLLTVSAHAASPEELRAKAMDPKLDKVARVEAIKAMYPEMLTEDGNIPVRRICVWDIAGKNGPIYQAAVDQVAELMQWGVQIELDAYTSESVLTEELKAGMCDAALFTGLRARGRESRRTAIDWGATPPVRLFVGAQDAHGESREA